MTQQQKHQPPPQQGFRTWPDETVSIHGLNAIESEIFRANNRMRLPNSYNGIVGELLSEFGGERKLIITDASSSSSVVSQRKFGERMVAAVTNITNNHGSNSGAWLTMTDASSAMMASQPQQPTPALPPAPPPPPRGGGIPSGASSPPSGPTTPRQPGRVRQLVHGAGRMIGKSLKVGGAIGGLVVGVNIISHVKTSREVDDFFGSVDENDNHVLGDKKRGPSPLSTLVNAANESKKWKRRVLVLPFENLKVIEHRANATSLFDNLRTRLINTDAAETTTIELRDLLRVIHSAARNPNVVALHANFGEGTPSYPLERGHGTEIRDAIRIFNESHRYHHTPNIMYGSIRVVGGNDGMPLPKKYSHAFGHSYDFNTYYLASSCSYVHLQSRGYLNLFGNTASNIFLGGMLTKYGITAHVFKHGQYKNAPSILTHSKYSKSHLENVTSMISSLNGTMCTQIEESRRGGNSDATTKSSSLLLLDDDDDMPWQKIFDHGSLTAMNSADIGLVDTIPPLDPVNVLMDMNKSALLDDAREKKKTKKKMTTMSTMRVSLLASLGLDGAGSTTHPPTPAHTGRVDGSSSIGSERSVQEQERVGVAMTTGGSDGSDDITRRAKKFEEKFGIHHSYSQFTANESITLSKYLGMLNKKDTVERTRKTMDDVLHRLSVSSTATSMILSALGLLTVYDNSKYNSDCDKIAVLTVDGGIDRKCSTRVVRALREIKTDKRVKAVVLRVNSPGGSVVSSELILEEIKHLDKPVICSMSNSAASGGYYISMNSEKIYANPTTITGSIGVFGIKFDASKLANDYGITTDEYPRGSHASTLNPLTPLTPDTKDNITRIIQDYYDYFKSIVSTGRSLSLDDVEKVAQGRVWTGEQAKEVGLVDAIGGLDRAVSYAKKTHATTEHVEVDYYPKKLSLMEQLGLGKGPVVSYVDVLQASVAVMIGFTGGCIEPGSTLHQFLGELTNAKIATTPHYMMTVDEETALDVILKGE